MDPKCCVTGTYARLTWFALWYNLDMSEELHETQSIHPSTGRFLLDKMNKAKANTEPLEYLHVGYQVLDEGEHFTIIDSSGNQRAELKILPATIVYRTSEGGIYHIDTYLNEPTLHGDRQQIDALPFNVIKLAQDII